MAGRVLAHLPSTRGSFRPEAAIRTDLPMTELLRDLLLDIAGRFIPQVACPFTLGLL
jgi:hypothetical protein